MIEKKKFLTTLNIFVAFFTIFIITIVGTYELNALTNTRYIKKETDEIRGYYTSLYFQGTGEGNCIVLENGIGHTSFELMNYIGEDVTKRDIEYNIRTLKTYYDKMGNVIQPSDDKDLYVKDVWGNPKPISNNTYKYEINVVSSTGEPGNGGTTGGDYMFSYQQNGTIDIGKKHSITLKVARKDEYGEVDKIESISIVVDLIKPYKEVYIINMVIVNRLIAFTNLETTQFEVPLQSLNIQTADVFTRDVTMDGIVSSITSKAFKVTLSWENLILDKRDVGILHNVTTLDEIMSVVNGTSESSNIDISKPYVIGLTYNNDDITKGELQLYIPQSSGFNIDFFPVGDVYNVYAKVEILNNDTYVLYSESYGGYTNSEITINDSIYVLGNLKDELIH